MQALVVQVMIRIGKRPARNCHPITIASLSSSPLAIAIAIVVIIITIGHRRHRHRTSIADHFSLEDTEHRHPRGCVGPLPDGCG